MKISAFLVGLVVFASAGVAQQAEPQGEETVQQYVVPDLDSLIQGETEGGEMFVGIELEVLQRRVVALEEENERLRDRLEKIEQSLGLKN